MSRINVTVDELAQELAEITERNQRAVIYLVGFGVGAFCMWAIARDVIERERDRANRHATCAELAERELDATQRELEEVREEVEGLEAARAASGGSTT